MTYPRVVFVDGPTGIGKDYLIERLEEGLVNEKELSVKVLRATDFALRNNPEEDRKYDGYETDEEKHDSIFKGHILLLEYIATILEDDVDHTDVVIVNRSFITFLNYNLWQQQYSDKRVAYLGMYKKAFASILANYRSLYLQVSFPAGTGINATVDKIIKRIESRNDGKKVDKDWIVKLVLFYHTRGMALEETVTFRDVVTSDDSDIILNRFFHSTHSNGNRNIKRFPGMTIREKKHAEELSGTLVNLAKQLDPTNVNIPTIENLTNQIKRGNVVTDGISVTYGNIPGQVESVTINFKPHSLNSGGFEVGTMAVVSSQTEPEWKSTFIEKELVD